MVAKVVYLFDSLLLKEVRSLVILSDVFILVDWPQEAVFLSPHQLSIYPRIKSRVIFGVNLLVPLERP